MPKTAKNASKNQGGGCQKQHEELTSNGSKPTTAEQAINKGQETAVLSVLV
jgi:hypothetical protein